MPGLLHVFVTGKKGHVKLRSDPKITTPMSNM